MWEARRAVYVFEREREREGSVRERVRAVCVWERGQDGRRMNECGGSACEREGGQRVREREGSLCDQCV